MRQTREVSRALKIKVFPLETRLSLELSLPTPCENHQLSKKLVESESGLLRPQIQIMHQVFLFRVSGPGVADELAHSLENGSQLANRLPACGAVTTLASVVLLDRSLLW
jgi:hypothetical protein